MLFCKDNRMISGNGGIYYGVWHPSNKVAVRIATNDKVIDVLLSGLRGCLRKYKAKDEEDESKARYVSRFIEELQRYRGMIKKGAGRSVGKKEAVKITKKAGGFFSK